MYVRFADIYSEFKSYMLYPTEADLVHALKEKSNAAYNHLYTHYRGALYHAILQIIPGEEAASDVLQESFLQIWKNIEAYDPQKGRLFTWMLKLTRNMAINHTRIKNFKVHDKNKDITNYVSDIDEKLHSNISTNTIGLKQLVLNLKPEFRSVLQLSYFQGLKQEEIAESLNIPVGTVKTRLRNAVLELKKAFV